MRRYQVRGSEASEGARVGEYPAEEASGGGRTGQGDVEGDCFRKLVSPSCKREAVDHLEHCFSVSERRACRVLHQPRSSHRYELKPSSDEPRLVSRIHEPVRQHPRVGDRRITVLLKGGRV